jgi:signal transduction histidine kinase
LLIKTEREDVNRVRLTVRDAGIGLPPESLDPLFNAFYTTKSGGMGIGLFVSRSIVERHQGRLWAEPNDGPGATFSFHSQRSSERNGPGAGGQYQSLMDGRRQSGASSIAAHVMRDS